MTESQLVRLQSDIVKEIEQYKGGSFSEKFRNWKNAEIVQRIEELDNGNDLLTKEELQAELTDLAKGEYER